MDHPLGKKYCIVATVNLALSQVTVSCRRITWRLPTIQQRWTRAMIDADEHWFATGPSGSNNQGFCISDRGAADEPCSDQTRPIRLASLTVSVCEGRRLCGI